MAKKTKKPYKFRQARKDAKAASKGVFEGKKPVGRQGKAKDTTVKQTLEEKQALRELSEAKQRQKTGKSDYIIDDKGRRVEVKATETPQERMARDRAAAKRAAYEKYPLEEGGAKKSKKAFKPRSTQPSAKEKPMPKKPGKNFGKYGALDEYEIEKNLEREEKAAKSSVKKKSVKKKAAVKPTTEPAAEKKMTRAEKSAANKARWASMTPAERKNWKASKSGAKPSVYESARAAGKTPAEAAKAANPNLFKEKPAAKTAAKPKAAPAVKEPAAKRPTLASLKKNEAKALKEAKARVAAKNKALADSAKGKTQTPTAAKAKATAKPEGKPAVKKAPVKKAAAKKAPVKNDAAKKAAVKKPSAKAPKKFGKTRAVAKGAGYLALGGELASLVKGSTEKDFDEINRLERKLANLTGKGKSTATAARQAAGMQLSNLASLATMGYVGKTRRQRMDELNKLIKKASPKELRYGPKGESLVPGTKAYKAGSTTMPKYTTSTKKPDTGAGGSTITGTYTVKKGDTLWGIAKNAGVSLAEIRAANPAIMKRKKYKQGNMIWSGTKVRIPKK